MLPFFRKMRYRLAEDNQPASPAGRPASRTGRFLNYARYAIGEIVLVVIGILIALQINNWNEERKSRNVEYIALTELKKSIESNIRNMDSVAIRIEHRISSIKIILRAFEESIPYHDSLSSHFAWGMIYDRLPINTGAYESLKGSGTQIVEDDELRFLISNYFDYHIGFLQNYLRELRDDFYNYMLGYLRENFKTFVGADQIAIPKDYEELKRNETFILSLGIFLDVQRDALNGTNAVRNRSVELLEKIDNRLVKMKKE